MSKEVIYGTLMKEWVLTENSDAARELHNQSCYGKMLKDGRVQLPLIEAFYLVEKERLAVYDGRKKPVAHEVFIRKAAKVEPNFRVRYAVF